MAELIQQGGRLITGLLQLSIARRPPPPGLSPQVVTESKPESEPSKVTTDQTIAYQKREIAKELVLLEGHLQQGCKIGGEACDCCEKHPLKIEGLAQEAAGISTDRVFKDLAAWIHDIAPKTTEEASASGQYDAQYPDLAIKARDFRKALML